MKFFEWFAITFEWFITFLKPCANTFERFMKFTEWFAKTFKRLMKFFERFAKTYKRFMKFPIEIFLQGSFQLFMAICFEYLQHSTAQK